MTNKNVCYTMPTMRHFSLWQGRLTLFLCFMALAGCPCPLWAVWEHAPISEATRFSSERSQVWEFSFIYHDASIYPGEFYCPGNAEVKLDVLNLSASTLYFRQANPKKVFMLKPGMLRKLELGKLVSGEHLFFLDTSPAAFSSNESLRPAGERMHLLIHAWYWPGPGAGYETAWIHTQDKVLPETLIIPNGRATNLFLGSLAGVQKQRVPMGKNVFEINPGTVTLTEIINPKSGTMVFPAGPLHKAKISVR